MFRPLYTLPEPRIAHGYVVTQDFDRPECCGGPMWIIPPRVAIDAFASFTTEVLQPDGSHAPVTIDSLAKLRAVERESETRERNGEGQRMIWRDYAQDRSNYDVHTIAPMNGGEKLAPGAKERFGRRSMTEVPADPSFGPGVSESNTSALGPD